MGCRPLRRKTYNHDYGCAGAVHSTLRSELCQPRRDIGRWLIQLLKYSYSSVVCLSSKSPFPEADVTYSTRRIIL
jgi:hypothetical protein